VNIFCVQSKGPFIPMQLNSTTLHVELRRYRLPHRRKLNCRRRSAMQLKALVDMSYKQACFFSIILLTFFSNSSLQNSISRQTRQSMSYMTSWPTNWVNWVTTFRTDRWQLFTLWTCRQLDVELCRSHYRHFADATQLNSTSSWFVSL